MTDTDLQTMLAGLRESQTKPTKRQAGEVLAQHGWCVFPIPDGAKFDVGLSHLSASIDPGHFAELADMVMARSECVDVNIALVPGRCVVPLVAVDLDGADAIQRFWDEAQANGHADVPLWLRVNTTRPDYGRHIYFVAPDGARYGNSSHRWGGEIRSAMGHVVMPPSTTGLGRYTWVGEKLDVAPDWVVRGMRGSTKALGSGAPSGHADASDAEVEEILIALSAWGTTSYAQAAVDNLCHELVTAVPGAPTGGRNMTLVKAVYRILDLGLDCQLNVDDALAQVGQVYKCLFTADDARDPSGEIVRCVRSWVRNKTELDDGLANSKAKLRFIGTANRLNDDDRAAAKQLQTRRTSLDAARTQAQSWRKETQ